MLTILRQERGLNQVDFAKAVKVSQAQISRYERGLDIPSPEKIRRMAEVLDVPIEYLSTKSEEKLEEVDVIEFPEGNSLQKNDEFLELFLEVYTNRGALQSETFMPLKSIVKAKTDYFARLNDDSMVPVIPKNAACYAELKDCQNLCDRELIFIKMPGQENVFLIRRLRISVKKNKEFYLLVPENPAYKIHIFTKEEFIQTFKNETGVIKGYSLMFANP